MGRPVGQSRVEVCPCLSGRYSQVFAFSRRTYLSSSTSSDVITRRKHDIEIEEMQFLGTVLIILFISLFLGALKSWHEQLMLSTDLNTGQMWRNSRHISVHVISSVNLCQSSLVWPHCGITRFVTVSCRTLTNYPPRNFQLWRGSLQDYWNHHCWLCHARKAPVQQIQTLFISKLDVPFCKCNLMQPTDQSDIGPVRQTTPSAHTTLGTANVWQQYGHCCWFSIVWEFLCSPSRLAT